MLKGRQGPWICSFVLPEQGKGQILVQVSMTKQWWILSLKILKVLVNVEGEQGRLEYKAGEAGAFCWEQEGVQGCVFGGLSEFLVQRKWEVEDISSGVAGD